MIIRMYHASINFGNEKSQQRRDGKKYSVSSIVINERKRRRNQRRISQWERRWIDAALAVHWNVVNSKCNVLFESMHFRLVWTIVMLAWGCSIEYVTLDGYKITKKCNGRATNYVVAGWKKACGIAIHAVHAPNSSRNHTSNNKVWNKQKLLGQLHIWKFTIFFLVCCFSAFNIMFCSHRVLFLTQYVALNLHRNGH